MEVLITKVRNVIPFIGICLLVNSCISQIDIDTKGIDHTIVVNSYINTDDTVFVRASQSASIFADSIGAFSDLQLTISDSSSTYELQPYSEGVFFLTPNNLIIDTDYRLSGISASGRSFTAVSSIPKAAKITRANVIHPAGFDEYGDAYTEYNIDIEDTQEGRNYFELYILSGNGIDVFGSPHSGFIDYLDPIIEAEGLQGFNNTSYLFTDELFESGGAEIKIRFDPFGTDIKLPFLASRQLQGRYIALLTLSEEYYNFRRSWVIHQYHQQNDPELFPSPLLENITEFLFKGDVQDLETNISGGLGVFAGFNLTLYKIE